MLIQIKDWRNDNMLFECECESVAGSVNEAVRNGVDLSYADLSYADLSNTDLDSKYCFLSISPIGSENGCLWVMKNKEGILIYNRGCFSGPKEKFLEAVDKKHKETKYEKSYIEAVDFIESQIKMREEQ